MQEPIERLPLGWWPSFEDTVRTIAALTQEGTSVRPLEQRDGLFVEQVRNAVEHRYGAP